jgi:hypothetical protein
MAAQRPLDLRRKAGPRLSVLLELLDLRPAPNGEDGSLQRPSAAGKISNLS